MTDRFVFVNPEGLHPTSGYAHLTIVEAGRTAHLAGLCPLDAGAEPSFGRGPRRHKQAAAKRACRRVCAQLLTCQGVGSVALGGGAGAENGVHLVEEDDDRHALAGLLPGPLEHQPDVPLGFPDVLVEQFRALDVQEEALALGIGAEARRAGRDLLGQRVGDRLGDQGLTAAGRAVEQDALGRPELVLAEQVRVQVGQLDRVPDLLDLRGQAADVVVGDVRDFLQDQFLDLSAPDCVCPG
jgi:hypothetical protein